MAKKKKRPPDTEREEGTPKKPEPPQDEVEEKIDEAGKESFPASDPPSWTPAGAGG